MLRNRIDFRSTRVRFRLVLEPGERFAEQDGGARRADGEGAEWLIDDGSPLDPSIEGRADQVDAPSRDPHGLAVGINEEYVVGVATGGPLGPNGSGAIVGEGASVGRGEQDQPREPSQRPRLPEDRTLPEYFAPKPMAAQPLRSARQADPYQRRGRFLRCFDQERWIARVEGEAYRPRTGGIENHELASVGGHRRVSVRADRQVLDRLAQLVLPNPATRGCQPADAIALLDQGQSELVRINRHVRQLNQADIDQVMAVLVQVPEKDLPVSRGGEPARGAPENPANSGHVGTLSQALARGVIKVKPVRAGE